MNIKINSIKFNRSLVDGPGVRTVVFLQGCNFKCKGCHNQSTWDVNGGDVYKVKDLATLLKKQSKNRKITISGGEPLLQKEAVKELIDQLEGFDIVLYTSYLIENVPKDILEKIKYIKTGQFVQEKLTTTIAYVGSSNQEFREVEHGKI